MELDFCNEEKIITYMKEKKQDKKIYELVKNKNFIPTEKLCYEILKYKLEDYVNLICEYYLGSDIQIKLFELRKQPKMNYLEFVKLLDTKPSKNLNCVILEENIKNAVYNFILDTNSDEIDNQHIEIINLYLETINIDESYKNKIENLIQIIKNNEELKKTLQVHIGIESELDALIDNFVVDYNKRHNTKK